MPGDRLLLDTNALIAWLARDERLRRQVSPARPAVTIFTLGEMQFGIRKSARAAENERALAAALEEFEVLYPNLDSARHYGSIYFQLRAKGRPIPVNDIWIAALALQHKFDLLTRDSHFAEIEGLVRRAW